MNRNRQIDWLTRHTDARDIVTWLRHLAAGGLAVIVCMLAIAALAREMTSRLRQMQAASAPAPAAPAVLLAPVGANAPPVASAGQDDVTGVARELRDRHLTMPVSGVAAADLVAGFEQGRADHRHDALDIPAPRGTRVLAVEDGTIAKLFWSNAGGRTIYQFDPSGRVAYYYAHLDGYADGLLQGGAVRRGDTLGFVGASGNADAAAPHLHFAIFVLTPERQWWKGTAIDPFPILRWPLDAPP